MAKGLDVGTSFIVFAEEGTKGKVIYTDFREDWKRTQKKD